MGLVRVAVAALLACTWARADVFSPGGLSRPHASLEGVQNCVRCHPSGKQLAASSCLGCHGEIQSRVALKKGFHGRLSPQKLAQCWDCHHEHQGREFSLVDFGPQGKKGFDHALTGWPLNGEHRKQDCETCHQVRRIADERITRMLAEQKDRVTFLGLPTFCQSCHFDEHRGQVGPLCRNCHDERGFKPASGFDHDQDARYPLRGRHEKVPCADCHPTLTDDQTPKDAFPAPKGFTYLKFAPVPHGSCNTCHDDVHEGKFGLRCEKCHTVDGWHEIRNLRTEREFHQKTRFPLEGRHLEVECQKCHGPFPGQPAKFKGLAFQKCTDCHVDAHVGQMNALAKRPGCDECHSVEGFKPSSFSLQQHQKTRYPLVDAHRAAACDRCHVPDSKLALKVPKAIVRQLERKKLKKLFSNAVFDFTRPLDRCESCHADVHAGQFTSKPQGCRGCHRLTSFADLSFEHGRDSRFPLTGKHATARCGSCHLPERLGGATVVRYKPLPTECAGCHADVHAGQFSPKGGKADCDACHSTEGFGELDFRHEPPFTEFRLDGRHLFVACPKCHPSIDVGGGVEVARYKPLPKTCAGCHEDHHRGEFEGFEP